MAGSDRSTLQTPPESRQGSPGLGGVEQWVMKSLNDLQMDIRDGNNRLSEEIDKVNETITKVDQRLSVVERKISKLIWVVSGAVAMLVLLYTGIELITSYFNVTIDLKDSAEG